MIHECEQPEDHILLVLRCLHTLWNTAIAIPNLQLCKKEIFRKEELLDGSRGTQEVGH